MKKFWISLLVLLMLVYPVTGMAAGAYGEETTAELPTAEAFQTAEELLTEEVQVSLYQCGSLENENQGVMLLSLDYENLKEKVYNSLNAVEPSLDLTGDQVTVTELRKAYTEVINDNPELFYVSAKYSTSYYPSSGIVVTATWNYRESDKNKIQTMKNEMNAKVNEIVSHVDSSMKPQEKLMVIHEALILNTEYSFETTWENDSSSGGCYTAYCVLVEGKGVCQGYALAFHMLAKRVGIQDQFVAATEINHAWNFVYLNGEGYHIDCTWDDYGGTNGTIRHMNFLLSDDAIKLTRHTTWNDPSITSVDTTYDSYYWRDSAYNYVIVKGGDQWYCAKRTTTDFSKLISVWADAKDLTFTDIAGGTLQIPLAQCSPIGSTLIQKIELSSKTLELEKGETTALTASLLPEYVQRTIRWSSSNEAAVSVSQDGKVTAVSAGTAVITAECEGASAKCTVKVPVKPASVKGQAYIQGSWKSWKKDGETIGTAGTRLDAVRIRVSEVGNLGIQYRSLVQDSWQSWKENGTTSGTYGKKMEAVQIKLIGAAAADYDIYYRVRVSGTGWLGWAKNGATAGTRYMNKQIECMQIKIVEKGAAAPGSTSQCFVKAAPKISYRTHVQTFGWQDWVSNGAMSGTSGQAKRLEAIEIKMTNNGVSGGVTYQTHVQTYGWQNWVSNGALSGTSGQAKRLEAIRIKLTGDLAKQYDVYYRVHAQSFGWLGWAKNGASAGTAGYAKRLEAIEIVLVKKGGAAPGSTARSFISL